MNRRHFITAFAALATFGMQKPEAARWMTNAESGMLQRGECVIDAKTLKKIKLSMTWEGTATGKGIIRVPFRVSSVAENR